VPILVESRRFLRRDRLSLCDYTRRIIIHRPSAYYPPPRVISRLLRVTSIYIDSYGANQPATRVRRARGYHFASRAFYSLSRDTRKRVDLSPFLFLSVYMYISLFPSDPTRPESRYRVFIVAAIRDCAGTHVARGMHFGDHSRPAVLNRALDQMLGDRL